MYKTILILHPQKPNVAVKQKWQTALKIMYMLKAIIIDDEPDCVKLLALQLKMYCPQAQVVAACTESAEGLLKIKAIQPDLVLATRC